MPNQKFVLFFAILVLISLGGILGGLNAMWIRHGEFPAYGWLADLIAAPVFLALLLYARRLKSMNTDEFAVTKKRYAAQAGFMVGIALFCLTGLFPIVLPAQYHAFLNSMDGADDAFIMGRVFGMAPFVIGLLAGQIISWAKYR